MNILEELKNDRLAVDAETPHVFIRQDLYRELLDTSMFPCAVRAMRMAKWKKWLLKLFAKLAPGRYEKMLLESQFKYYLRRLIEYINEERMKVLGMTPASIISSLNFTVTDANAKPLYVGVYVQETDQFYLSQWMGGELRGDS